jgi:WS/DGAT/MGAT family acyltransferase
MGRAALTNGLQIPAAIATHSQRALVQGFRRARHDPADALPPHVPHVAFNGKLTPDRSFAFASVPLGPLRDAKKHFDVTMNDVLLEIVASSLRHGLREHGELPEEPVVGLCPVSIRRDGDHTFGNQISSMPVSLATDLDDVPARLAAIHESSDAAKRRLEAGAFETLTALGECLVPGILKALTRVALAYPSIVPLPANLVISNVRGLSVPMYLAGARVEEIYPMSMLQIGNGMNVTAFSHDDQVDFGFLVESKLVRDPWLYADGVREALVELEAAVAARSKTLETDAAPALPHSSDPPDPSDAAPVLAQEDSADSSSVCSYSSSSSRSMGQSTNGQAVPGQASSPSEAVIFEDEPLNLQLMITQFRHLRAPARDGILRDEKESSPGGDRA